MKYIKTYEFFGLFKKKKPITKVDKIGTAHDLLLDFVDEGKVELKEQNKDYINCVVFSNDEHKYKEEVSDTTKRIESMFKEWDIRYVIHSELSRVYLYILSDDFYNKINDIFRGLRKAKVCNNSYQFLLVKDFCFYAYVNGEDISISQVVMDYLAKTYNMSESSIRNILEEIIPPMYKLGHYMRCRTLRDHKTFNSIRYRYHQPEL